MTPAKTIARSEGITRQSRHQTTTTMNNPLPNLIKPSAIYRVHAIRTAIIAGESVEVKGEQIGGNFSTKDAAERFAGEQKTRCDVSHVGGRE